MTRLGTAIAAIGLMTLAACDGGAAGQTEAAAPDVNSQTSSPAAAAASGQDAAAATAAPAYAAIYPGAEVEQQVADEPAAVLGVRAQGGLGGAIEGRHTGDRRPARLLAP